MTTETGDGDAPPPISFGALLEDTLTIPFALGRVFSRHAQAEEPSLSALAVNVAVYAAAAVFLFAMRVRLTFPAAVGMLDPVRYACGIIFGAGFFAAASFAAAGVFHALILAAGGSADFHRSYHILSLLSLFLPACVAATMFHYGWPALAAYWTYLAVSAVETMAKAPGPRAGAVLGVCAAAAVAAAWFASLQVQGYLAPAIQMANLEAQAARQAEEAKQAPVSTPSAAPSPAAAEPSQGSSLSLIAPPSSAGPAAQLPAPAQLAAQAAAVAQQVQQNPSAAPQIGSQAIGQVLPMLDNPNLTRSMPPEQAKQVKQLTDMLKQLQGTMQSGKPLTQEQQAQMMKAQQAAMQMMMQNMQKNPGAAPQPQPQQPAPAGNQQ